MTIFLPYIGHNDLANDALFQFCEEYKVETNPNCFAVVSFDDYCPNFDCDTITYPYDMPKEEILNRLLQAPYAVDVLTFYPINSDYQNLSDFFNENR